MRSPSKPMLRAAELKPFTIYHLLFTFFLLRAHHSSRQARNQRTRNEALRLNHKEIHPARDDMILTASQPPKRYIHHLFGSLRNARRRLPAVSGFKEVGFSNAGAECHHLNPMRPILFPERF